jgi:uncharacterized protein YjbK
MRHLEIEFKQMLTKEQFHVLLKHFPHAQLIQQNNRYFYYKDASIKIATRIRTIGDESELTFKQQNNEGVIEHRFKMNFNDEDIFNRLDVLDFLSSSNLTSTFLPIGSLLTHRYLVIEENQEICIDENHYLDQVDYELEVESLMDPKKAQDRFLKLLLEFSIEKRESLSKFARFIKQKGL